MYVCMYVYYSATWNHCCKRVIWLPQKRQLGWDISESVQSMATLTIWNMDLNSCYDTEEAENEKVRETDSGREEIDWLKETGRVKERGELYV